MPALPDVNASTYPAFRPDAPRLVTSGGPIIAAPKVVTVTWDEDADRPVYEAFATGLGASSYWSTMRAWGVGAASDGGHVRISTPFDLTLETVDAFVAEHATAPAQPGWPAYAPGTIYALYVPRRAPFTAGGAPYCGTFGFGYHAATPAPDGGTEAGIPYTVVCGSVESALATVQESALLAGAATNPQPATAPAVASFDDAHVAFGVYESLQSEVGLACSLFSDAVVVPSPPFDFAVNALWSNWAGESGHSPCVPASSGVVQYGTTTLAGELQDVTVDLSATGVLGTVTTKGIKVALGASKTISIGYYSDAPTSDWTVSVVSLPTLPIYDASGNPIPNGTVDVTIDRPMGRNGHRARLTVTPRSASPAIGAEYIELQSGHAEDASPHTLPIFIGQ